MAWIQRGLTPRERDIWLPKMQACFLTVGLERGVLWRLHFFWCFVHLVSSGSSLRIDCVYRDSQWIWDISDISNSTSVSRLYRDASRMDWLGSDIFLIWRRTF